MATTLEERSYLGDLLIWEQPHAYSRTASAVLLSGQNLKLGAVLGKDLVSPTVAGGAAAGNTGDGTIGTISAGAAAQRGVYRAACIEPATDGGRFAVFDPSGKFLGVAVVGTEFASEVVFTISDGATDFVAGDSFTVTVTAGTYKFKAYDNTAADGAKRVAGILLEDTDASAADASTLVLERDAVVIDDALVWGAGIDAAEKAVAKDELLALGIRVSAGK